jgi:hypothetical protein
MSLYLSYIQDCLLPCLPVLKQRLSWAGSQNPLFFVYYHCFYAYIYVAIDMYIFLHVCMNQSERPLGFRHMYSSPAHAHSNAEP